MGYAPAEWAAFSGAVAAVADALAGLLFMALSVKGTALSESPALASRAAQTLALFMTSVLGPSSFGYPADTGVVAGSAG